MALNTTADAGAVLTEATQTRVAVEPPVEALPTEAPQIVAEAEANAEPVANLGDPVVGPVTENVQVAGLVDNLAARFGKRVNKAIERSTPKLPNDPVIKSGQDLLIRVEDPEVTLALRQIAPEFDKGINFPKWAEALGDQTLAQFLQETRNLNAQTFGELSKSFKFDDIMKRVQEKGGDHYIAFWAQQGAKNGATPEDLFGGVVSAVFFQKQTMKQAQAAIALPIGSPERAEAMTKFANLYATQALAMQNLSQFGRTAGQNLAALSQAQRIAGMSMKANADEMLANMGAEDIEILAQKFIRMKPGEQSKMAEMSIGRKGADILTEVYINALLSNPTTHVVNVVGTGGFMLTRMLETAIAGGIGAARSKITGNTDRAYFRESVAQLHGISDGFLDGLALLGRALVTEEPSDVLTKVELRNRRAIGTSGDLTVIGEEIRNGNIGAAGVNMLGTAIRLPGRFIMAEDELFRAVGYRMALRQEAFAQSQRTYDMALEAGKTADEALAAAKLEYGRLIDEPPAKLVESARDAARYMTFQRDLDGFLGKVEDVAQHPALKLTVVPFFRTPTNIMLAINERSPLTFWVDPAVRNALKAGGREADIAMSKIAMGSMIFGSMAYMLSTMDPEKVRVNGAGPSDPEGRAAWEREGFLPYSIATRQEDGTWRSVTYSRMDPMSAFIGMAADYNEYVKTDPSMSRAEALATAGVAGMMGYLMQQPMLTGISDMASTMRQENDPLKMSQAMLRAMVAAGGEASATMMPGNSALGAAVSRYNDPTRKNTMLPEQGLFGEDPTQLPVPLRGFYDALQKAKAQNPMWNKTLPAALNEWGEPIQVGHGAAWEFVSPVRIKDSRWSPVDQEIQRLGGGISRAPRKMDGVELNALQYNRLIELTNRMDAAGRLPDEPGYRQETTLLPMLSELIATDGYKAAPLDDDRRDYITSIVSSARSAAKKRLLMEDPYLAAKIDSMKR